jgi:hypothetical protein
MAKEQRQLFGKRDRKFMPDPTAYEHVLFQKYDLPEYPGLKFLYHEINATVPGPNFSEIFWYLYVSDAQPTAVVEFYRERLDETAFSPREEGGGTWRFPPQAPQYILDILPIDAKGPHRQRAQDFPLTARTAVIMSERFSAAQPRRKTGSE